MWHLGCCNWTDSEAGISDDAIIYSHKYICIIQRKYKSEAENKLNVNVVYNIDDSIIEWISRNVREANSVEKYIVYL